MKKIFLKVCVIIATISTIGFTQDIHYYEARIYKGVIPPEGSAKERDSLLTIYLNNIIQKNANIVSTLNLRNAIGEDNRDWLVLYEFRSMAEWEEAENIDDSLAIAAWSDTQKRMRFFKEFRKYWPSSSSQLYYGVPKFDKVKK